MIPVTKDEHAQQPIPDAWRPTLRAIVKAFVEGDYALKRRIPHAKSPRPDQPASYLAHYGETLIELPEQSWKTSCCQWQLSHWEVLVDLYTRESGKSDLVLYVHVREGRAGSFRYEVRLLHVP